ncbi:MAG: SUMF1/EgtB/PvdO family nonheme iron enzyme [Vitreoscilla sp.]|nr:SUMF1/EgtB/PvdO family nonheme iron enzyme [Vitreoscilla sp.]
MRDTPGVAIRQAGAAALAAALRDSRHRTLATFARVESALGPGLVVPQWRTLNPPLWELGHIGWFQSHWLARNPVWRSGWRADPTVPRHPGRRPNADALYDSSHVPHDSRWSLDLPSAEATRADLAAQLDDTLALLAEAPDDDDALYFFRLALLHEDMHHEAALYMAQALGLPGIAPPPTPLPPPADALSFEPGPWRLGFSGPGFAFDNELGAHELLLGATRIDAQVLRWAEYLPFVEAGAGPMPRHLRRAQGDWQVRRHGEWQALDVAEPACHLSWHEAQAWCAWAGRRLPSEAEWERAAVTRPEAFHWGAVWEWTASAFAPYPGFQPHPYRDYSAPWFDGRPVLRGASFATSPRMVHPRYRNYFPAERNDIFAGFRTCAF